MAPLAMKIKVEARMRKLLEEQQIPLPDEVEYGYGCIRLFWNDAQTVLVVDIDEDGEGDDADTGEPPQEAREDPIVRFPPTARERMN